MSVLHTIQNEKNLYFNWVVINSFQNKNLEYFITNTITQKKTELVHGLEWKKKKSLTKPYNMLWLSIRWSKKIHLQHRSGTVHYASILSYRQPCVSSSMSFHENTAVLLQAPRGAGGGSGTTAPAPGLAPGKHLHSTGKAGGAGRQGRFPWIT